MNAKAINYPLDKKFQSRMSNRFFMSLFMAAKLPLGLFAGIRIDKIDGESCTVSVPYGWRSQNPFRSIYFAAQSMAAELSSGALAMLAVKSSKKPVSMLITKMEAEFIKKGTDRTHFRCEYGRELFETVQRAIDTGEPQQLCVDVSGLMPDGTVVSKFSFTWSFKAKTS